MVANLNQKGVVQMIAVVVMLLVLAVGAVGLMMRKNNSHQDALTNQAQDQPLAQTNTQPQKQGKYILSGFISKNSYDTRNPEWDGDREYATFDEALAVAKQWQHENGDGSIVEIIELDDVRHGKVWAVIDRNGIEKIP